MYILYLGKHAEFPPRLAKQQALTHGDEVVMDELCSSSRHLCFVWLSSGVSQVEIKFGVPQIVTAKHSDSMSPLVIKHAWLEKIPQKHGGLAGKIIEPAAMG
jgi:hypothetical protein